MPQVPLARRLPLAFRPPVIESDVPVREAPAVSFADLVRMLAEGIADGQARLDRASAQLVAELAITTVSIVPGVTETIAADGSVTFKEAPAVDVSLLALGVTPTFYQFSEATVEVAMDLHLVESEQTSEDGKRRLGLFADTVSVRSERKLNRDVTISSKLRATLVPVPSPVRLDPVRTTIGTSPG